VKRREFITLVGGAAVAWPIGANGQQSKMPVIGFLGTSTREGNARLVRAFNDGLKQADFSEGENVLIDYRWAQNDYDKLPELAADLIRRQVSLIVAAGSSAPALAVKRISSTIPVVFAAGSDPVKIGLVANLNRPGGNITGISFVNVDIIGKRLELLHELVPAAGVFGVIVNPKQPMADIQLQDIKKAARSLGKTLHTLEIRTEGDMEASFATLVQLQVGALFIVTDPTFNGQIKRIAALTTQHAIPAIYSLRDFPEAGGLASYATDQIDAYRQAGVYAGRILKGEKPGDLPVQLPTKFELVINRKTAKTLGLQIPTKLLFTADEVIE
jgi:putative ABC transport system substrate-binding protein